MKNTFCWLQKAASMSLDIFTNFKTKDLLLIPFIWDKELVLIHLQKQILSRNWSDIEQNASPFRCFKKSFSRQLQRSKLEVWRLDGAQLGWEGPVTRSMKKIQTWSENCKNNTVRSEVFLALKARITFDSCVTITIHDVIIHHDELHQKKCDCYKLHYRP